MESVTRDDRRIGLKQYIYRTKKFNETRKTGSLSKMQNRGRRTG